MMDTNPHMLTLSRYSDYDLHDLRALHALSFKTLAKGSHSVEQIFAHIRFMNTDEYAEDIAHSHILCARDENGDLVATSGWMGMENAPETARIRKVFVHPRLAGTGQGRKMVKQAESYAAHEGYQDFFVRANINAKGFYKRLGYLEIKPGVMSIGNGINLPIVFMHKT